MLYHLLYISEKSAIYNEETDLDNILSRSRIKNLSNNVTGLLIKNDRFFIQFLEGKRDAVVSIFNRINLDPRHMKIRELLTYHDEERLFPQWSMGLVEGKDHQLSINELLPILYSDLTGLTAKEKVIPILKKFNQI